MITFPNIETDYFPHHNGNSVQTFHIVHFRIQEPGEQKKKVASS